MSVDATAKDKLSTQMVVDYIVDADSREVNINRGNDDEMFWIKIGELDAWSKRVGL